MKKSLFLRKKRVSLLIAFIMFISVLPIHRSTAQSVQMQETGIDNLLTTTSGAVTIQPPGTLETITARLSTTPQFLGLNVNMAGDQGNHDPITDEREGKEGWLMQPSSDRFYMYCAVDDDFIYGNHNKVEIEVEYYDEGNGKFTLLYDSETDSYKQSDIVRLEGSNQWKTHSFKLNDADFRNEFQGQDIRIGAFINNEGMSETDVLISSITVRKIVDQPKEHVSALLKTEPEFNGITAVTSGDGGNTQPYIGEKDGRQGWIMRPQSDSFYIWANIDDAFICGGANKVKVKVDYYDEGDGKFTLLYDSTTAIDKQSDVVNLEDTKTWKTHVFILEDANFENRLNGQDIRIGAFIPYVGWSNTDILISKIEVSKMETVTEEYERILLNDFESEDEGWEVNSKNHLETIFERTMEAYKNGYYGAKLSAMIDDETSYIQINKNLKLGKVDRFDFSMKAHNLKSIQVILKDAAGYVHEKEVVIDDENTWIDAQVEHLKSEIINQPVMGVGFKVRQRDLIDRHKAFTVYLDDLYICVPAGIRTLAQVQLGKDVIRDGINVWAGDNGAGFIVPEDKGKDCWMTNKSQNTLFFYFAVDDGYIYNEECDVEVDVEYLDEGKGMFTLQYNAGQGSDVVKLQDTGEWKTYTFQLNRVNLCNAMNNADFRIGMWAPWMGESKQDVAFSKVVVRKVSDQGVSVQPQSDTVANIFTQRDDAALNLKFTNNALVAQNVTVHYNVKNHKEVSLVKDSFQCELQPFASKIYPLDLAYIDSYGTFNVEVEVVSESGVVNKVIPFSRIMAPETIDPDNKIGTCTHFAQGKGDPDTNLKIASQAGVGLIRDEMYWADAERTKGEIVILPSWEKWVDTAIENGMEPLVILSYGNQFYDDGKAPKSPEAIAAYAKYAATIAEYFKGRVKYFQVWNEWNGGLGNPDRLPPEDYANLLIATSKAIKEVLPEAVIVGGATSGADITWIERTLKAGAFDYMDVVSIHPYCYPTSPENGGVIKAVENLNQIIENYGSPKDIWITEIGWPTHSEEKGGVSEEVSAQYAVRMYTWAKSTDLIDNIFWYDLQNDGVSEDLNEDNFGLIRCWVNSEIVPAAAKLNYVALSAFAAQMEGAKFVRTIDLGEGVMAYQFYKEEAQKDILVLWSTNKTQTFGLKISSEKVEVVDLLGNSYKVIPVNQKLDVTLTGSPIYLVGDFEDEIMQEEANFKLSATQVNVTQEDIVSMTITRKEDAINRAGSYEVQLPEGWDIVSSTKFEKGQIEDTLLIRMPATVAKGKYNVGILPISNGEVLANLKLTVNVVEAYAVTVEPVRVEKDNWNEWAIKVILTNNTSTTSIAGQFNLLNPSEWVALNAKRDFKIEPLSTTELQFKLPYELGQSLYALQYEVALTNGKKDVYEQSISFLGATKNTGNIVVDGIVSEKEWGDSMPFIMNEASQYITLGGQWGGKEDLSAEGRMKWDEENLYLVLEVVDNQHSQKGSGSDIWGGDCIQFCIDPGRANGVGSKGWNEIGFALNSEDQQVYNWQWIAAEEKATGKLKNTEAQITREDNKTIYEIAIKWKELLPKGIEVGPSARFGFSILLNDEDEMGRKGYLAYMGGIGLNKDPNLFGDMVLVETEEELEPEKPEPEPEEDSRTEGGYEPILTLEQALDQLSQAEKQVIVNLFKERLPYTLSNTLLTLKQLKEFTHNKFTNAQLKELYKKQELLVKLGINLDELTKLVSIKSTKYEGYKDISETFWAKEAIKQATELGIASGLPDGTFAPHAFLEVADASVFLDRVLVSHHVGGMKLTRSTVEKYISDKEHWAFWEMASIASRLNESTLATVSALKDKPLSRALLAQVLYEITEGKLEPIKEIRVFKDTQNSVYKHAIDYCVETGLLNGVGKDEMAPNKALTRAELMTVLIRLNELLK